jgi:hypothetical protein
MLDFSALELAVTAQKGIKDSVVAFIENLRSQLNAELANDAAAQAKVNAVMDEVLANSTALNTAIQTPPTP